jgi:predicted  nucleic acid-binding Zn-ribbon protein
MTLPSIIGVLGGLFGVLSLIAGAAVYLRASYAKARIDALNAEIEEEKRRSAQLRVDIDALQAKSDIQEAKIAALNELVTQRAQLQGLRDSIDLIRSEIAVVARNQAEILRNASRPSTRARTPRKEDDDA